MVHMRHFWEASYEIIAFELYASGDTLFQPLMVDWVGGPASILASEICFICLELSFTEDMIDINFITVQVK